MRRISLLAFFALLLLAPGLKAQPLQLALPTPNKAIFGKGGSSYYMYTNRTFQGVKSTPWQGGMYGYVRTPILVGGRKVYRRFHEGIDIRPVQRNSSGTPIDPVMAIDKGRVVHASDVSGASNYGKYVVIQHDWSNTPIYSLYAHLNKIVVKRGQRVDKGQEIGVIGWTGRGIDKTRAHLHFEVNLLLNSRFDTWHSVYFKNSPNRHGIYNGLNMLGLPPAELLLSAHRSPGLTVEEFVRNQPSFFTVQFPNSRNLELVRRYPWMVPGEAPSRSNSWLISFTRTGLPVRAEPSQGFTRGPRLVSIKSSKVPYTYMTRGLVTGKQGAASLSQSGLRLMHLLCFPN